MKAIYLTTLLPVLGLGLALEARAEMWPSKPIRAIVPFAAGSTTDIVPRVVFDQLSSQLRQSIVVENRAGAGGSTGSGFVAKAEPDGYTLLLMSNTHTTNESLIPNRPYNLMRDFVPVAPINYSDLLMVVHPSTKVKNLQEFIALLKKEPGKLNYASSGPGTPYHMAGELFKAMTETNIVHVPHKSSGDMRSSVIGGHVQMMFDAITVMAEGVRAGQLVALGTTGKQRSSVMPDVPTVAEAGVPGYEATIWLGLMAPAKTPKAIVDKLNAEVIKVINRPDVKEAWAKQGAVPMIMTPAEFDAYLRADIDKWARVVKISGATIQ